MTERSYTLKEIDRMREAISYVHCIRGVDADHLDAVNRSIEDHLRTYMLAGISPEDLELKAKELEASPKNIYSLEFLTGGFLTKT